MTRLRRRLVRAAVLVAALGLAAAAVGTAASPPPRCALRGSRTLYRDSHVRVYERRSSDGEVTSTFACLLAKNKRVRIADAHAPDELVTLEQLHVAAPFVAYDRRETNKELAADRVEVVDLRTGAKRGRAATDRVTGVAVSHRGSLAWMDAPDGYAVHVLAADAGQAAVLDGGPDVEGSSFASAGRHVYWLRAGQPRTASMP
jgi:hypothetical protein